MSSSSASSSVVAPIDQATSTHLSSLITQSIEQSYPSPPSNSNGPTTTRSTRSSNNNNDSRKFWSDQISRGLTNQIISKSLRDEDLAEIFRKKNRDHSTRIRFDLRLIPSSSSAGNQPTRSIEFDPKCFINIPSDPSLLSTQSSSTIRPNEKGTNTRNQSIVTLFGPLTRKKPQGVRRNSSSNFQRNSNSASRLVGGTITITGPIREIKKLNRVIEIAVYSICHLRLESALIRDLNGRSTAIKDDEPRIKQSSSTPPSSPSIAFAQDTPPQSTRLAKTNQSSPRSIKSFYKKDPRSTSNSNSNSSPSSITRTNQSQSQITPKQTAHQSNSRIVPGSFLYRTYHNHPYRLLWKKFEKSSVQDEEERLDGWELILGSNNNPSVGIETDEDNEIDDEEEEGEDDDDEEEDNGREEDSRFEEIKIEDDKELRKSISNDQDSRNSSTSRTLGKNLIQKLSQKMNSLRQTQNRSSSVPSSPSSKNRRRNPLESIFHHHATAPSSSSSTTASASSTQSLSSDKKRKVDQPRENDGDNKPQKSGLSPSSEPVPEPAQNKFVTVANILNHSILSVSPGVKFPLPNSLGQLLKLQMINEEKEKRDKSENEHGSSDEFDSKSIMEKSKIGLGLIMKNNYSIDGFSRHQSVQFLFQRIIVNNRVDLIIKSIDNFGWASWKYYHRPKKTRSISDQNDVKDGSRQDFYGGEEDEARRYFKDLLSGNIFEVLLKLIKNSNSEDRFGQINEDSLGGEAGYILNFDDDYNENEESENFVLVQKDSRITISLEKHRYGSVNDEIRKESDSGDGEDGKLSCGFNNDDDERKNFLIESIILTSRCKLCHQSSKAKRCSIGSLMNWFMKFLELIIYDRRLRCQNLGCRSNDKSKGNNNKEGKGEEVKNDSKINSNDAEEDEENSMVRNFYVCVREKGQMSKKIEEKDGGADEGDGKGLRKKVFRVKIEVETIKLYEVKLPKSIDLKLINQIDEDENHQPENDDDEVIQLRKEIDEFYDSLLDRVLILDEFLGKLEEEEEDSCGRSSLTGSLEIDQNQRPGSIKDAKSIDSIDQQVSTSIKASLSLPPQRLSRPTLQDRSSSSNIFTDSLAIQERRRLLGELKKSFKAQKSQLVSQIDFIRSSTLNNVRKPFVDLIIKSRIRLRSWESKHLSFLRNPTQNKPHRTSNYNLSDLPEPRYLIPFYAQEGNHALPADNSVIIRENELSSIIAFTLSSGDYKRQLRAYRNLLDRPSLATKQSRHSQLPSSMVHHPHSNSPSSPAKRDLSLPIGLMAGQLSLPNTSSLDSALSKLSPPSNLMRNNSTNNKFVGDPDDDEFGTFGNAFDYTSQIGYRKPPRASRSILSFRGLSKQRSFDIGSLRSLVSSRITSPNPNCEIDPMAQAGQSLIVDPRVGEDRILNELIKSSEPRPSSSSSSLHQKSSASPAPVAALLSRTARTDTSTVSVSHEQTLGVVESSSNQKTPRLKRRAKSGASDQERDMIMSSEGETSGTEDERMRIGSIHKKFQDGEDDESSVEILSDDNHSNLLTDNDQTPPVSRLLTQAQSGIKSSQPKNSKNLPSSTSSRSSSSRLVSPFQSFWRSDKGLCERQRIESETEGEVEDEDEEEILEGGAIDGFPNNRDKSNKNQKVKREEESEKTPHIKHRFEHGSKEITCTVWYADEFERLRRGIDLKEEDLIRSLSRSDDYEPIGGKSRSKFKISKDSRFILKGLINDNYFNESERDSLLEFSPKYFNYLFNRKGNSLEEEQDEDEEDEDEDEDGLDEDGDEDDGFGNGGEKDDDREDREDNRQTREERQRQRRKLRRKRLKKNNKDLEGCSMMIKILGFFSIKVKARKDYEKKIGLGNGGIELDHYFNSLVDDRSDERFKNRGDHELNVGGKLVSNLDSIKASNKDPKNSGNNDEKNNINNNFMKNVMGMNKKNFEFEEEDYILMENLFYRKKIERKFDLKGINNRYCKGGPPKADQVDENQDRLKFSSEGDKADKKKKKEKKDFNLKPREREVGNDTSFDDGDCDERRDGDVAKVGENETEEEIENHKKLNEEDERDEEDEDEEEEEEEKSLYEVNLSKEILEKNFTGWDGNWIEGNLGNLILIDRESKEFIRKVLKKDLRFLKLNRKIDYSILLGIQTENTDRPDYGHGHRRKNEIVIGLIDIISSFNLVNMIESKSKRVFKNYYYNNSNNIGGGNGNNGLKNEESENERFRPMKSKVQLSKNENNTGFQKKDNNNASESNKVLNKVEDKLENNEVGIVTGGKMMKANNISKDKNKVRRTSEDLVTILPPNVYENRLRRFIDKNFVDVPEKWSEIEEKKKLKRMKKKLRVEKEKMRKGEEFNGQEKLKNNNNSRIGIKRGKSDLMSRSGYDEEGKRGGYEKNVKGCDDEKMLLKFDGCEGGLKEEKGKFEDGERSEGEIFTEESDESNEDEDYYCRLNPVF